MQLEAAFGCPVIEAYAMTENAHQMTSNQLPPGKRKPGFVGCAAGPEVAVMSPDGRLLGAGRGGRGGDARAQRDAGLREQSRGQ